MSRLGYSGFDGAEPELALGSVTGLRWWDLQADDVSLRGVQGRWEPGENVAACNRRTYSPLAAGVMVPVRHAVPDEDCACGFWAYWTIGNAPNPHGFAIPVLGVIEGYGRTLIGDRGFRCQKARIVALHFPGAQRSLMSRRPASFEEWLSRAPDFIKARGEGAVRTWEALTGSGRLPRPPADPEAQARAEADALYRLSVLEMQLEERYGVPVYATAGLMADRHPATRDYG